MGTSTGRAGSDGEGAPITSRPKVRALGDGHAATQMPMICVLGGSSNGVDPRYAVAAQQLGQALARRSAGIVYGGTTDGLMGHAARAARLSGATVIGVVPQTFYVGDWSNIVDREASDIQVVENFHARKARMEQLCAGYVVIPGGYGTMDELFEAMTWVYTGIHTKPIALLNTLDYYRPLLALLQHGHEQGFMPAQSNLLVGADPAKLVARLLARVNAAPVQALPARSRARRPCSTLAH